jgi:hypothetical protein
LFGLALAADGPNSLGASRALWAKAAPASYSYVVQERTTAATGCLGPGSKQFSLTKATITVRNGQITRIAADAYVPANNGRVTRWSTVRDVEIPHYCLDGYWMYKQKLHTIEGLFDFIEREQAEHGGSPNPRTKYDSTFGFPVHVDEREVLDGSTYSIREFKVLK